MKEDSILRLRLLVAETASASTRARESLDEYKATLVKMREVIQHAIKLVEDEQQEQSDG